MTDVKLNGSNPSLQPQRPERRITAQASPQLSVQPGVPQLASVPVDQLQASPAGSSMQAFEWLDQQALPPNPFATFSAHFRVSDLDGLDQRSQSDLQGQLDADITLGRELFDYSVAQANQQNDDFHFGISFENGQYRIPVAYKAPLIGNIGLGSIYIKPEGGQLKVSIG
ncbi:MAG: hypothetical protein CVV27_14260, partial [Candidatus Melainabacteria bacterium HGW-Melainabacteria-1]